MLLAALAPIGAFAGAKPARADGPPAAVDPAKEAEALLADLKSDTYDVREAARRRLASVAARVRPVLEAHREDPDPEVRRVVLGLLAGLGASVEPTAPAGELGDLDLVTLRAEGTLVDVLARFDEVAGGRVRLPPAVLASPVSVELVARPYFEALSQILDAARLDVEEGFDDAGQAQAGTRDPTSTPPVACVGPFRLDVESVSTTKLLRGGGRPRFVLGLRLLWSPSVQVATYASPSVVSAKDPSGAALVAPDPGHVVFGAGGSKRMTTMALSLEPAGDTPPDRIERLELSLRVRVRRAKAVVEFDAPLEAKGPVVRRLAWGAGSTGGSKPGPTSADVTLERFAADPERSGWWVAELTAKLPPGIEPAALSASLVASDGLLRPMFELSSRIAGADGTVRMTVRAASLVAGAEPKAVRVTCFAREEEIPVRFVLTGIPLR